MTAPEIGACRSCGSTEIPEVLSLGDLAISDFLAEGEPFDTAPLTLVRCADCTLVQLKHTADRDRLYRSYWYRSGTNESMVAALRDVAKHAQDLVLLDEGDTILDIGANDGTLLRQFPRGLQKLAYEPARTFWPLLNDDIRRAGDYFPMLVGGRPVGISPRPKVITSIACFYDTDDPNAWVAAIKHTLARDGVWINQLAYLPDTLRANNFGDICHEHLTYWSTYAFEKLLHRHGLVLDHAASQFNDVNGGSVRWVVRHGHDGFTPAHIAADAVSERALSLFRGRIEKNKADVVRALRRLKMQGKLVHGYGASTKGSTYLQVWNVGSDLLPCIADRNPDKWGKVTPTGIPVVSEDESRAFTPDYYLALPYHFMSSFLERERAFLERGGKFLVPFPTLREVGLNDLAAAA